MDAVSLQIQRQIAGTVNTNSNVIFETVVSSNGDIVYNSLTGEIIINKAGRYFINWGVATQSSIGSNNVTFSIQSSQGDDLVGNSPIKTGEVVGFAIIQVDASPITLRLINLTSNSVFYSTLVSIKANLVLGEIPEEVGIITDATGVTGATSTIQPNQFEIYVQSGAVGGNGTHASPFGTIQQGITAVSPTGIVHILGGTYPITSQILINKAGVTLKGYPSTLVILQAAVVPFVITGSGVTIDGLTITSDIPYAVEFIQLAGINHKLTNNFMYGPPQADPSSGWVTNRGFVTQSNIVNLIVQNNIFYFLRQPAYLNPNSTGYIMNNLVYNTRGFVVY